MTIYPECDYFRSGKVIFAHSLHQYLDGTEIIILMIGYTGRCSNTACK